MAKKKAAMTSYITKSMLPATNGFITWPDTVTNTTFAHLGTTHTLDTLRRALPGEITNDAVIPNMLMPAYQLERRMRCNNPAEADDALKDECVQKWLQVLCAVLFNDDNHLQCYDVNLDNVLGNPNASMILRVLAKTLIEAGNPHPTFRLFKQRTGPGNDDFKPIGFTYPGLRVGVCPVVGLEPADFAGVKNDPQGWLSCGDPIEYLRKPENQAYCARIDDYLTYTAVGVGGHAYDVFEKEYRTICDEIRTRLAPIAGVRSAFFPQRINKSAAAVLPISYIHWFTDSILCVSCDQTGEGVMSIPAKDYKCVLPIQKLSIQQGGNIQQIRDSAIVVAEGDDLIVSFSYNGTMNSRRYTKDKQILCTGDENPLGSVMLWPNKTCSEWDRYFSYLSNNCLGRSEMDLDPFSIEVYDGTTWHIHPTEFRRMQREENNITQNFVFDCVIETNVFPSAISLKRKNEELGMLVPTVSALPPVPDGAKGQLGVDFGTTNTIAYFHSDKVDPEVVAISDSRKVLLQDRSKVSDSNTLLSFLFAPDTHTGSNVPFKTAVQVFPAQQAKAFLNAIAPLQYRVDLNEKMRELLSLDDDLKWPEDMAAATNPTNSVAFLEYVMLLWLWEVRKKYNVLPNRYVFTYPGAMDVGFIQNLTKSVLQRMPKKYTDSGYSIDYATEASVVINFLEDEGVRGKYDNNGLAWVDSEVGYLLMDIGGGSVDVSLWQGPEHNVALCTELSLSAFAGNRIQLEQVYPAGAQRPQLNLLAEIMGYSKAQLENSKNISDAVAFYQFAKGDDIHLNAFRQQWTAHIDTVRQGMENRAYDGKAPMRGKYRKTLEMYFHFMFFLNGYVYGQALLDGRLELVPGTFAIMMGGNGSRMYDLCGSDSNDNKLFKNANIKMFLYGLKYAGYEGTLAGVKVDVVPSIMHKHEVAYGASKFEMPPIIAHPAGEAVALDAIDDEPVVTDTIPAWLGVEKAATIRPKAKEFFLHYLDGLNKVSENGSNFMMTNFGYQLDENFFNKAQAVIHEGSLPQAAAAIFRTLLTTIGSRYFQD